VLLGYGIRLFDKPWGDPVRLELLNGDDPSEKSPNHPRELMRAAPSETSRSDKALLQTVVESDNAEGAARVV
jgi:hypothetical protein